MGEVTFKELMAAATRAHNAGDAAGAKKLVDAAKRLFAPQPPQGQQSVQVNPAEPPTLQEEAAMGKSEPRPYKFGETFKKSVEGPAAATGAFLNGALGSGPSPTAAYLEKEGFSPFWVDALSPTGDIGMTVLAAIGTGVSGVAGLAGEAMPGTRTDKMKFANDLRAMADVAVPEVAGVSGMTRAGAKAAKVAEKAANPTTARQVAAQATQDAGVTPSLGMTGKTGAMTAAVLEKLPGSGGVIARDASRAIGEIAAAAKAATRKVGEPAGARGAGETLQSGLTAYVGRFKENAQKWFGDIPIDPGMRVEIPATLQSVAESRKWFATNPELASKLGLTSFDAVLNEAATNGMTWQALKDFRSKIGEAVGSIKGPLADQADGNLKGLYATLTQDMETAARKAGPEAYAAWKSANEKYAAGADRISQYLDGSISAKSPERAFEAFDRMTAEGASSADATRMRKIKASLKPGEWNTIAASIVDRLGTARAGAQNADGTAFSAGEFLTNWNKMTQEAKALLLPDDVRVELSRLALVAERAKAANAERNFSNTGTVGAWTALLYMGPANAGLTVAGSHLSSRALTSATFLNAVNRLIAGDRMALVRMSEGKGAFAQDAKTILRLSAQEAAAGNAANSNAEPAARSVAR